jgi:ketosteroid isomerase-like protein
LAPAEPSGTPPWPRPPACSVRAVDPAEQVRAANQAFYEAFERRDLDAMSGLWEHSARARCTHPGWATLRGWAEIAASFFTLFQASRALQFVLTEVAVEVAGDVAWVSLDENLLGDQGGATVAAVNVFLRQEGGRWRLVCHHGSVVAGPGPSADEGG